MTGNEMGMDMGNQWEITVFFNLGHGGHVSKLTGPQKCDPLVVQTNIHLLPTSIHLYWDFPATLLYNVYNVYLSLKKKTYQDLCVSVCSACITKNQRISRFPAQALPADRSLVPWTNDQG